MTTARKDGRVRTGGIVMFLRTVCYAAALSLGLAMSSGLSTGKAHASSLRAGACTAGKLPVIKNGSFENGVNPPTFDLRTLYATSTRYNHEIASWIVRPVDHNKRGSVDWNQRFQASNGERTVDLDGNGSPGAIRQKIENLVVGHIYRIAFDLAGNPEGPPTVKRLRVNIDGRLFTFSFDTTGKTPEDMGWTSKLIQFRYSDKNPWVTFASGEPNDGA